MARGILAAALALSAAVHLDLADSYDRQGEQVTVGGLFRLQAALALLVALWVLLRRRGRGPLLAAAAVGLASTLAVVVSVYVRLPAVGPLPEIYEPVWYGRKQLAAGAAAVATVVAAGLLTPIRSRRGSRPPEGATTRLPGPAG